jgi:phasin family protein
LDNQLALFTAFIENFEKQCNSIASLSQTAFTGLAKLVELNISTTQTALIESAAATKQYLSTDPKEWLSLTVVHCQPAAGKAFNYMRHTSKIVSETQAEFSKTAEVEIAETNSKIMSMVDALAKSTPAGLANPGAHLKEHPGKAGTRSSLVAAA